MNLRLIAAIVGIVALIGAYMLGRADGNMSCTSSTLVAYQEGVENDAKVDKQVNRMVEPDLDRALSRWMH